MRIRFWLFVAILLSGCVSSATAQVHMGPATLGGDPASVAADEKRLQEVNALMKQAYGYLRNDDIASAFPILQQCAQNYDPVLGITARKYLGEIYAQQHRPADVIQVLKPLIYPNGWSRSIDQDLNIHMTYVLALLDTRQWPEAAAVYEHAMTRYVHDYHATPELSWPGYDIAEGDLPHTLPDVHFTPESEDVAGLRTQARLLLATRQGYGGDIYSELPIGLQVNKRLAFKLDQVQQALKYRPRMPEAMLVQGHLLMEMKRYPEARATFTRLLQTTPREAQPEIKAALSRVDKQEAAQLAFERQQQARVAEQAPTATKR